MQHKINSLAPAAPPLPLRGPSERTVVAVAQTPAAPGTGTGPACGRAGSCHEPSPHPASAVLCPAGACWAPTGQRSESCAAAAARSHGQHQPHSLQQGTGETVKPQQLLVCAWRACAQVLRLALQSLVWYLLQSGQTCGMHAVHHVLSTSLSTPTGQVFTPPGAAAYLLPSAPVSQLLLVVAAASSPAAETGSTVGRVATVGYGPAAQNTTCPCMKVKVYVAQRLEANTRQSLR